MSVPLPFPGVRIGVAERAGVTGCTVLDFSAAGEAGGPVRVARDARGGSVCWTGDYRIVHALCLTGGSVYGLEAIGGVTAELLARRGGRVHWTDLALVAGGAVYDYDGREPTAAAVRPDAALGRAALREATDEEVPVGRRGAGRGTQVGAGVPGLLPEPGGQGAAGRRVGGVSLAVVTVVNALGAVRDRTGAIVRGHLDPATGRRHAAADRAAAMLAAGASPPGGNTTLTVAITDARPTDGALAQWGRQVHASMARAIDPFHTAHDGDVLWAVSTDRGRDDVDPVALGVVASELAWDAVLAAVR